MTDLHKLYDEAQQKTVAFRQGLASHQVERTRNRANSGQIISYLQEMSGLFHQAVSSGTEFSPDQLLVDLSGLYVDDHLTFPPGDYPAINFADSYISQGATFENVTFRGAVSFTRTRLQGPKEKPIVTFHRARFERDAKFRSSHLLVAFDEVIFNQDADFEGAHLEFLHIVNGCRFEKSVLFRQAQFYQMRLEKVAVAGSLLGSNAVFYWEADFSALDNTVEPTVLDFDNAEFKQAVAFDGIGVGRRAIFRRAKFYGPVSFKGAKFRKFCDFNNATFSDSTDFSMCTFAHPPTFHGARVHPDTSFTDSTFTSFRTEKDARAYRRLKEIMHEFKFPFEEGRFFACEQRTLANLELAKSRWSFVGRVSKTYDLVSEYGQNGARPILWLIVLTVSFGALFLLAGLFCDISVNPGFPGGWATDIPPWLGLALQNIVNPLAFFGRQVPYVAETWWVAALSVLQSLFSIILIALEVLALRRRFTKRSD